MDLHLEGRTVLVTGAGSGIGRATAVTMAAEGALVILADIDKATLEETAALIPAYGKWPVTITADLATPDGVTHAATAALLAAGGALDIFVSNAGRCEFRQLTEATDDDWDATMAVNLYATVRAARILLPAMTRRGGSIVITSSDLAKQPELLTADYAASKAALASFAKTLALTASPLVRVNAVAPGPVRTGLWERPGGISDQLAAQHGLPRDDAVAHELALRQLPLGRLGEPHEVADLICFLASDRASYITGTTVDIGGGSNRFLF